MQNNLSFYENGCNKYNAQLFFLTVVCRQLHTPTNFLLLSLGVSDFFVGFLLLFQIMLIEGCWYLGDIMCVFYVILDTSVTSSSIGIMVLISVDRYIAICDPLLYPTKVSPKRVKISVVLCWTCSLFFAVVLFRDNLKHPGRFNTCYGECVVSIGFIEQVVGLLLSLLIPITVIIVLYIRVFVVAVFQGRAMRSHIVALTRQSLERVTVKKSEIKAARTLGVVVIVFLICLCPFFFVTLSGQNSVVQFSSVIFLVCLFYFNSCLNPVIYAFSYPWFRRSIKIIVTFQVLKSGSSDTNLL